MFPISQWKTAAHGYEFGEKTWYTAHHLGVDHIVPKGTPLYAPFDGIANKTPFPDGGEVITFTGDHNGKKTVIRFMHLDRYGQTGYVSEGTIIGYTGNTGKLTTGAHLHTDVSFDMVKLPFPGNFTDPMQFAWEDTNNEEPMFDLYRKRGDGTVYFLTWPMITSDSLLYPASSGEQMEAHFGKNWNAKVKEVDSFNGIGIPVFEAIAQLTKKATDDLRADYDGKMSEKTAKIKEQDLKINGLAVQIDALEESEKGMTKTVDDLEQKVEALSLEIDKLLAASRGKDDVISSLEFKLKEQTVTPLNDRTIGELVAAIWDKIKNRK